MKQKRRKLRLTKSKLKKDNADKMCNNKQRGEDKIKFADRKEFFPIFRCV